MLQVLTAMVATMQSIIVQWDKVMLISIGLSRDFIVVMVEEGANTNSALSQPSIYQKTHMSQLPSNVLMPMFMTSIEHGPVHP